MSCESNSTLHILTRHKNDCFMYILNEGKNHKFQWLNGYRDQSDVPYTSVDLDRSNPNSYCTADVKRNISIWDITKSKCISMANVSRENDNIFDNWSSVKYGLQQNSIKFIDRKSIKFYDTRISLSQYISQFNLNNHFETEDYLSSLNMSVQNENFTYVGSNHSIHLIDQRLEKNQIVKTWIHRLKSPPLLTDVCANNKEEFLIVSSHFAGDNTVIKNTWKRSKKRIKNSTLTYSPSSALDTLTTSKYDDRPLDLEIINRLISCQTGCRSIINQENGDVFLITQNNLNDIFYQKINYEGPLDFDSPENRNAMDKLQLFKERLNNETGHLIDETDTELLSQLLTPWDDCTVSTATQSKHKVYSGIGANLNEEKNKDEIEKKLKKKKSIKKRFLRDKRVPKF